MELTCADWAEITNGEVLDVTEQTYQQPDFFDGWTLHEPDSVEVTLSQVISIATRNNSSRPVVYSRAERQQAILRYKLKKSKRRNTPYVYISRRRFAQSRPRHKGRFCAKQVNV
jgi:hypothetical protein